MITIRAAESESDMAIVRALFVEYQRALGVDLCFQAFDAELASLPGRYARPAGRLLLVTEGDSALGVVGLRALTGVDCEMKRLYVRSAGRGLGVGRRLVVALIEAARLAGYHRMLLDTLPNMTEAQALYRSIGFAEVAPYCENPIAGTLYMAYELTAIESRV